MDKVIVIAAGNEVYLFNQGDERADLQYMACVGSNLDTEKAVIPADRIDVLLERIAEDDTEVIDCRK